MMLAGNCDQVSLYKSSENVATKIAPIPVWSIIWTHSCILRVVLLL